MEDNKFVLEVSDLHTTFKTDNGDVSAVNGVSFKLEPGKTLGIVGESGSGKSVTAYSIMQILAENGAITGGSVKYKGEDITKWNKKKMADFRGKCCSIIFQDPMTSLNPVFTVGYQRVNQYPHELSGGMRQRVMIAMALACEPDILIADEPTTALDVTVQAQILELLKKLTKEKGTSVIMITHDLGVVASMCDRIAIMYAGQIVEEGTVDEIFYEPHHPYTKGLLNSINNSAKDNDEPLVPIPGTPPDLLKLPKGCAFMSRCPYTMKICEVQASPVTTYSETHCCRCWLECMDETKITVSREEVSCQ